MTDRKPRFLIHGVVTYRHNREPMTSRRVIFTDGYGEALAAIKRIVCIADGLPNTAQYTNNVTVEAWNIQSVEAC